MDVEKKNRELQSQYDKLVSETGHIRTLVTELSKQRADEARQVAQHAETSRVSSDVEHVHESTGDRGDASEDTKDSIYCL